MGTYARLIDFDYIINNTKIDKNVDAKYIEVAIDESQDINIQETLGYNLYTTIMTMVYNQFNNLPNSITDAGNINYYTLLVDYIQKCQKHWVVYNILPDLNWHLTNKAVDKKSADGSQPSDLSDLTYLRNIEKGKAEFYVTRVREYIVNNPTQFPEYWMTQGIDRIYPKAFNYNDSIYLSNTLAIPEGIKITSDIISGGCGFYF